MNSRKDEMPADVVTGQKYAGGTSSADAYYSYMLLQEKLKNSGAIGSAAKEKIKTASSERETIELQILEKLVDITESSPEHAQLVDITGSRDRYEMARILAETVYDKMRAESILQFYTVPKADLQAHFARRTIASTAARSVGLAALSSGSDLSAAATTLGTLFPGLTVTRTA
jgi:hypothetical protein